MENVYITERIVNLSDCEKSIQSACSMVEMLRSEMEKDAPSMEKVDAISKDIHKTLLDVKYFEFLVERRKTVGECQ